MSDYHDMLGVSPAGAAEEAGPRKRSKKAKKPPMPALDDGLEMGHVAGKLGKRSEAGRWLVGSRARPFLFTCSTDPLSREVRALQSSSMLAAEAEEDALPAGVPLFAGFAKPKVSRCLGGGELLATLMRLGVQLSKRKPVRQWLPTQYLNREGPGGMMLTHVRPLNDPNRNRNTALRLNTPLAVQTYVCRGVARCASSHIWQLHRRTISG